MQLPQWLARFNRHVTNRFWRLSAGWIPAHGILQHVGRRSGKAYRTPLMVFDATVNGQPGLAIMLSYGPDRDWLKNLRLPAAPLGDAEGLAVADAGGHRDPVEDLDGEPRGLEIGHAIRV